mgnify:CR=1 FL=1
MIQKTLLTLGLILASAGIFAACTPQPDVQVNDDMMEQTDTSMQLEQDMNAEQMAVAEPTMNVVELAHTSGSFETLLMAAQEAGLVDALSTAEVTLFAPTDEAFAALPEGTLEDLMADPEMLSEVLQYHVVPGTVTATDIIGMDNTTTLQGEMLEISTDGAAVMVNDATILQADVMATNGVIHVIDTVLMPSGM